MKKYRLLFLFAITLFCFNKANSQDIIPTTDKKQYNIGDRIELNFKIPFQEGKQTDLIYNRANTDTLELQQTKIDTIQENGKAFLAYKQTYMSFIPGLLNLGDSLFVMTAVDTGMMITRVQPVEIEILQYPIDTLKAEVKDIKPLLEEPFHIREILPLIYLILGIAAAIVGLYFLIKYLRNRPVESKPQEVKKETTPPHIKALKALEELRLKRLGEQGFKKQYYSELTEIVRTYLEERFSIFAKEMTTEEIVEQMRHCKEITIADLENLNSMFSTADLVKFAKYSPDDFCDRKSWNQSKDFVDNTTINSNTQTSEQ